MYLWQQVQLNYTEIKSTQEADFFPFFFKIYLNTALHEFVLFVILCNICVYINFKTIFCEIMK